MKQFDTICEICLEEAKAVEKTNPLKAENIRENVAQAKLHLAELDAALVKTFGCSLNSMLGE